MKLKLIEDFSAKESHISSLTVSNHQLEEELKNFQEISLSKNLQSSKRMESLETAVKELTKENSELDEKLTKQTENYEEELENLSRTIRYAQDQFSAKKKENMRLVEKLGDLESDNDKIKNLIFELEEKIKSLEKENEDLIHGINNREKKIQSLSLEMTNASEDLQESNDHFIESLNREINVLNLSLKSCKDQNTAISKEKIDLLETIDSLNIEIQKKAEIFEKKEKKLYEQILGLKSSMENAAQEYKIKEQQLKDAKDEVIQELQNRILLLKQDKAELEATLQELQDQIQVERISSGIDIPLSDELNLLRESYNSRGSTPRGFLEPRKTDFFEKELQLQILRNENANLKSQMENLVPDLLLKLPEHQSLIAEKKKVETEFLLAKEYWTKENSELRTELEQTEYIALNANLNYAEAATDRDLYQKMYLDVKKVTPRKSWFKKKT